jgi:hypothetical protein
MRQPEPATGELHETQLVRAFLLPQLQERYLELLSKPHRRKGITNQLAHFKHLDRRWADAIPNNEQDVANILVLLKAKGAPDACYAVSEENALDGREIPLATALKTVVGSGRGAFLSCLPGRLAYFEDEDDRWILERKDRLEAR